MLCIKRLPVNLIIVRHFATEKKSAAPTSAATKLGGGIAKKGAVITTAIQQMIEAETDPSKLVNYCCGLNYKKEQEPIKLKSDEEYPEWLFKLYNLEEWNCEDLEDKDTWRYWTRYNQEGEALIQMKMKGRFPLRNIPDWLRNLRPLC